MLNRHLIRALCLTIPVTLSGCGFEAGDLDLNPDPPPPLFGVFLDSAIAGLSYETETLSGETNENGEFRYREGETIAFSIGDIELGNAPGAPILTPLDLVEHTHLIHNPLPDNDIVVNMVRFLQTLDQDGDPGNGIVITDAVHTSATATTIDFSSDIADFESDTAVLDFLAVATNTGVLVDASEALAHFETTLSDAYTVPPGDPGTVEGVVRDAQTSLAIANVDITVRDPDFSTIVQSTTTDANGNYTLSIPPDDDYFIHFSAASYHAVDYYGVNVTPGQTTILEPVQPVADSVTGNGVVSGNIKDALTGESLEGVSLTVLNGMNNRFGAGFTSGSSNASGDYSMNLPTGSHTIRASLSGYVTGYFSVLSVGGTTIGDQDGTITPGLADGVTRIVLTWGDTPSDLDSHLTGPNTSGGRFHVDWTNKGSDTSAPFAELDVDDTSSFGPETTTIYRQEGGVYRFSVHDFTNRQSTSSTALANSGAKVEVYQGEERVAVYNVPNDDGTLWTVFELDGDRLTPVNSITYESEYSNIRSLSEDATDAALVIDLPAK